MDLISIWKEFINRVIADDTLELADYYDEETDCTFLTALKVIDKAIRSRNLSIIENDEE